MTCFVMAIRFKIVNVFVIATRQEVETRVIMVEGTKVTTRINIVI